VIDNQASVSSGIVVVKIRVVSGQPMHRCAR
jgi:hypothetical protein